jgi:hypothetical protein
MNNDNFIELDIEVIEGDNHSMELEFEKTITSKETSSSISRLSSNVERKSLNSSSKFEQIYVEKKTHLSISCFEINIRI